VALGFVALALALALVIVALVLTLASEIMVMALSFTAVALLTSLIVAYFSPGLACDNVTSTMQFPSDQLQLALFR